MQELRVHDHQISAAAQRRDGSESHEHLLMAYLHALHRIQRAMARSIMRLGAQQRGPHGLCDVLKRQEDRILHT